MRVWQRERKIKAGTGFLRHDPKGKLTDNHPSYRGAILLNRDFSRGRRIYIHAWVNKDPDGATCLRIEIANQKKRDAAVARIKKEYEVKMERSVKAHKKKVAAEQRAEQKRIERETPKEIRREDVL